MTHHTLGRMHPFDTMCPDCEQEQQQQQNTKSMPVLRCSAHDAQNLRHKLNTVNSKYERLEAAHEQLRENYNKLCESIGVMAIQPKRPR